MSSFADKNIDIREKFETIIEGMTDAVCVFDSKGEYILFNKSAKEMFFPTYEYMNKTGDGYYQAEYFDYDGNVINAECIPSRRVLNGEKFSCMRMLVKFPDKLLHLEVSGTPLYDGDGNFLLGVLCSRDVTGIAEKEMEIKKQKEQLQAIFDNMSDALFIFDAHGKYNLMNEQVIKHFTKIDSNKIGVGMKQFTYYDENGNEISFESLPANRILRGETIKEYRMLLKNSDEEIYVSINGKPVYDNRNKFLLGIMCMRFITDEVKRESFIKQQQEQLLKAEIEKRETIENAMKLKDEFLYLITHEFKTPLTVISSALQAMDLLCRNQMPVKAIKFLQTIKQNTNRQLRLVNNLLEITRISAGHIKLNKNIFDIVFLTQEIVKSVQIFAQQKNIKVSFTSRLRRKEILIDEEKYERILLNLLSNALKFTPGNKSINVTLSIKRYKNRNMVSINVQDEGIGIPKDKQSHIFERFGQADTSLSRQAEGTGIGLHLSKLLVNALDGHITLESEEGKGSTFTVMLPAAKAKHICNAAFSDRDGQLVERDSRLIQAIAIEFSDIYL